MKHKIFAILTLSICFVGFSQTKKWTLRECVDYAYQNNISVRQGENNILSNEQDIRASKGNFYPSLSFNANQSLSLGNIELFPGSFVDRTFHSTNLGLSVSQTLYSGTRIKNLYEQSKLSHETSQLQQGKLKDDIGLLVVNTYLNVLFAKENLETAIAQYEFSKGQLKQVQELVDAGVQPQANIYDAEATLSNDEQRVVVAENNRDLALLQLAQILQLPIEGFDVETVDVEEPSALLMYNDVSEILDFAMQNRNEIKIAEKNKETDLNVFTVFSPVIMRRISKTNITMAT